MKTESFLRSVMLLTGTEVKGENEIDHDALTTILSDESRIIDCSQFNELLLLVHKDRVESPFFEYFFGISCTIGQIATSVERFQKTALWLYGNFVFAYRKLSRIKDAAEFRNTISEVAKDPSGELDHFKQRKPKLLEVDRIDKDQTPFVGYLSAREASADFGRCELLWNEAKEAGPGTTWELYLKQIHVMADPREKGLLDAIIANYRSRNAYAEVSEFGIFLADSLHRLRELKKEVKVVQTRATRNQNTYLTWDHMDVYFATSMRKAWEYKDLYDFIERLTASDELKALDLRYFDPTQAFTENRVNKGLVEALMLKRARCTVYSVQDTDTLGKDSELASTLAQGKPVIAYIPDVDPTVRARQLSSEDPATILERLRFVLYADDQLAQRITDEQFDTVDRIQDELIKFCGQKIWQSIRDEEDIMRFRDHVGGELERFCSVIAASEKAVYDKRAGTLKDSHPLGIQVNLETGVANGVLVVRTIHDCASLLRRVLLSDMELSVEENNGMWYLREKISSCIYRVVTNDRKLNNCFWNFYLR